MKIQPWHGKSPLNKRKFKKAALFYLKNVQELAHDGCGDIVPHEIMKSRRRDAYREIVSIIESGELLRS